MKQVTPEHQAKSFLVNGISVRDSANMKIVQGTQHQGNFSYSVSRGIQWERESQEKLQLGYIYYLLQKL